MSDDVDMGEVRIAIGTGAMEMADALDEETVGRVAELRPLIERAVSGLEDNGLSRRHATHLLMAFVLQIAEPPE